MGKPKKINKIYIGVCVHKDGTEHIASIKFSSMNASQPMFSESLDDLKSLISSSNLKGKKIIIKELEEITKKTGGK